MCSTVLITKCKEMSNENSSRLYGLSIWDSETDGTKLDMEARKYQPSNQEEGQNPMLC